MTHYGVTTDYEYNASHKRDRIVVWSAPWMSTFEAEGYSLPKGDGYMLTTYNGDKVRVACPTPRTDDTYERIAAAVGAALNSHHGVYDHDPRPDDDPEEGDRCKDCGENITWIGPSTVTDWMHVNDARNR